MHVVLMGDSILDNLAYTKGEPDVVTHLRKLLPRSARATLCAVDGSTTSDLKSQIAKVPSDASHLVISLGGNDALLNSDLLSTRVTSTTQALALFGQRMGEFEAGYRAAVEAALALHLPTAICTIYNGNLDPPGIDEVPSILAAIWGDAQRSYLLTSTNGGGFRRRSPAQVVNNQGGTDMGDKGSKDKGKKEKQKKAQHNLKEKRKIKKEKRENK